MLREAVLLAEDAHGAQAQLIPCSHDPHRDFSPVGRHETLERHVETRPIPRNLGREKRPAPARAEARHGTPEKQTPARPQQKTRSQLHDALLCAGDVDLLCSPARADYIGCTDDDDDADSHRIIRVRLQLPETDLGCIHGSARDNTSTIRPPLDVSRDSSLGKAVGEAQHYI